MDSSFQGCGFEGQKELYNSPMTMKLSHESWVAIVESPIETHACKMT